MGKKSKVLALLLCLAMLVVSMPLMAYAEDSPITITDIDVQDDTDVVHVTVEYTTDATVGDQITILATTTSYDVEFDTETGQVTNIAYIDQFDKPEGETKTFSFDVSKDFLGTATVLYIKMGGTDVLIPGQSEGNVGGGTVILYGDVTGDGIVNTTDAAYVLQYYAKLINEFPSPNGLIAADVTGEGIINTTDAAYILQYYAKLIDVFPVEG